MDFHRHDRFAAQNMERESEDCLYLNVFSPYDHEDESKVFPILVWIHGGSFLAGSADTGIDMEVDIRIHYHCNVQFILCGRYIYIYIYIHVHRCEKTISEEDAAEIVGDEYNKEDIKDKHCNYQDHKITCLTADLTPYQQIECLRLELNLTSPLLRKALAIELGVSKMVVDHDLVPTSGAELVRVHARIPIMTGVARKEWAHKKPQFYNLHRKASLTAEESAESVFRIIEGSFHDTTIEKLSNATLHLVANASFVRYIDDPSNTFETSRVVSALQKMEADIEFVSPCQKEIDAYVQKGIQVYAYSFDYVPESPIYEEKKTFGLFGKEPVTVMRKDKTFEDRKLEAFHGLDHAFIFSRGYSSNFDIRPYTKRDETMSKILTNMITNFAKKGDPSIPRFTWPQFTVNASEHVSINIPPK
uniref:COesterase domain-containing protein n=1 Tax=Heterorhabditis bacteriophora TaxID=37862 RepID=A0A1I7XGJ2_HETBA